MAAGRARLTSTLPAATSRSSGVKNGLPAGSHRITLTILDKKPESSKGRFINIAGFEIAP